MQNGVGRDANQVSPVVDSFDANARRKNAGVVDSFHLRLHAFDGRQTLLAAAHEDDPLHDIVIVVVAGDAQPRLIPDADGRNIAQQDWRAVARSEHRVSHVVHRVDDADTAHHRRLRADIHCLAADVDVAVVQHLQHLREGQAIGGELFKIDCDLVRLVLSTPPVHIDHAGHRLETPVQDPVLDSFQVSNRVPRRSDDPVAKDLARRTGGRDCRTGAIGKRWQLRQPIDHPLLGFPVGKGVRELKFYVR